MHKNQGPDSRDDNQQTDMRANREVTLSIKKNIKKKPVELAIFLN